VLDCTDDVWKTNFLRSNGRDDVRLLQSQDMAVSRTIKVERTIEFRTNALRSNR